MPRPPLGSTATSNRRTRLRWLLSMLAPAAFFASQLAYAAPAAAQVDAARGSVPAPAQATLETQRLGGADRYDTSLQIAHEIVRRAGGSVEDAVVASGVSWLDAAVGASLAGRLDAPLLLMPPGGLRPDALSLLSRAGVAKVFAVGGASAIPEADLGGIRDLGVSVERVGGDDPIATALAAAALGPAAEPARSTATDEPALTGTPDTVAGIGTVRSLPSRAVVLAGVEASDDAQVAAPFAARAGLPLLLTSPDSLDAATARVLDERAITHVVVSGVHGPLSDPLLDDLDALGISVVQLGNFGSLPASAAAASFSTDDSTGQFAAWSQRRCAQQSPSAVGLASNLGVWDAFSATPLLRHLCAPLLLTTSHGLDSEANAALYRALHSGTETLLIFGGRAAIGAAAVEQATSPRIPIRIATVASGAAAAESDQTIVVLDENRRQRRYLSDSGFSEFDCPGPTWSPQRRHIAFSAVHNGTAGVFVLDVATGSFWRVTPRARDYWVHNCQLAWSADGAKIGFVAYFEERIRWDDEQLSKAHVADIRHRSLRRMTSDDKLELSVSWAPNDHRLAVLRVSPGLQPYNPNELLIIDTATRQVTAIDRYEVINSPRWSPDGSMISVATWNDRCCTDMAHPSIGVIDAHEPHRTLWGGFDRILAWAPSGCCVATFSGYYADDISLVDLATGRTRPLVGGGADYPEGTGFRSWSRDGQRIIATDDQHDPGGGWWVHRLLAIETLDGTVNELPLEGPQWSFDFGGFSPDDRQIVYGASEPSDSVFQLRIVDLVPAGQSRTALDLTSDLPRLSGLTADRSAAGWQQLHWTAQGIYGTVLHFAWPW